MIVVDSSAVIALLFGEPDANALAKSLGAPLLFIGNDFTATDVIVALAPD